MNETNYQSTQSQDEKKKNSDTFHFDSQRRKRQIKIFKYLIFFRAMATTVYTFYQAILGLKNQTYVEAGASGLMISLIFFGFIDGLIATGNAFPFIIIRIRRSIHKLAGLSTPPEDSARLQSKRWTIWELIADYDLISDVLPLIVIIIHDIITLR